MVKKSNNVCLWIPVVVLGAAFAAFIVWALLVRRGGRKSGKSGAPPPSALGRMKHASAILSDVDVCAAAAKLNPRECDRINHVCKNKWGDAFYTDYHGTGNCQPGPQAWNPNFGYINSDGELEVKMDVWERSLVSGGMPIETWAGAEARSCKPAQYGTHWVTIQMPGEGIASLMTKYTNKAGQQVFGAWNVTVGAYFFKNDPTAASGVGKHEADAIEIGAGQSTQNKGFGDSGIQPWGGCHGTPTFCSCDSTYKTNPNNIHRWDDLTGAQWAYLYAPDGGKQSLTVKMVWTGPGNPMVFTVAPGDFGREPWNTTFPVGPKSANSSTQQWSQTWTIPGTNVFIPCTDDQTYAMFNIWAFPGGSCTYGVPADGMPRTAIFKNILVQPAAGNPCPPPCAT